MPDRSYPNPAFGYWRAGSGPEAPLAGGQGSMAGQKNYGVGFLSQGQGSGAGGWDPTIVYLLIMVIVEMIVFGFISRALR